MSESLLRIDLLPSETNDQAIGVALTEAGETWGNYEVLSSLERKQTSSIIEASIRTAMDLGMTDKHLKSGTPCYACLVGTMQTVREVNGLQALANATRDNYLSRIRKFVAARGAIPFDMFGNLAVAAQKAEKKAAVTADSNEAAVPTQSTTQAAPSIDDDMDEAFYVRKGAPCLAAFLTAWVEENNSLTALHQIKLMAQDVLNQCNVSLGNK